MITYVRPHRFVVFSILFIATASIISTTASRVTGQTPPPEQINRNKSTNNGGPTSGITGPNGAALPPLATKVPVKPPAGQVDLRLLNADAPSFVGQTVTVDVVTSGVNPTGNGDGPSVICYDEKGEQPGGIDFLLDPKLSTNLTAAGLIHGSGPKVAVRIKGKVKDPPARRSWKQVVVEEIGLIGETGLIVATFDKSGGSVAPGAALPSRPVSNAEADRKLLELARAGDRAIGTTHELQLTYAGETDETVRSGGNTRIVRQLTFWNSDRQPVLGLKIFVPEPLAGQLRTAHAQIGGRFLNARVTVKVTEYDRLTQDILCSAEQVQLYDADWSTIRWSGKATKETTPEPPPPSITGPVFTGPPPNQSPPLSSGSTDSSMRMILILVALGVIVVLIGGGIALFLIIRKGQGKRKGSSEHRSREDGFNDDDEDSDDDGRRHQRRRGRR